VHRPYTDGGPLRSRDARTKRRRPPACMPARHKTRPVSCSRLLDRDTWECGLARPKCAADAAHTLLPSSDAGGPSRNATPKADRSAGLKSNHALQHERCAHGANPKRPRSRRAKDDRRCEPEQSLPAPAARTEGKSRDAFARDDERCTARAARHERQDGSAAYAVDALPKERPRHARAGGHAEDHATQRKQTNKARLA
jgi:hypothetical protein